MIHERVAMEAELEGQLVAAFDALGREAAACDSSRLRRMLEAGRDIGFGSMFGVGSRVSVAAVCTMHFWAAQRPWARLATYIFQAPADARRNCMCLSAAFTVALWLESIHRNPGIGLFRGCGECGIPTSNVCEECDHARCTVCEDSDEVCRNCIVGDGGGVLIGMDGFNRFG